MARLEALPTEIAMKIVLYLDWDSMMNLKKVSYYLKKVVIEAGELAAKDLERRVMESFSDPKAEADLLAFVETIKYRRPQGRRPRRGYRGYWR